MATKGLIVLLLVFQGVSSAQCVKTANSVVERFSFTGSAISAVLTLGSQEKVCFAVRNLPRNAFVQQFSGVLMRVTVDQAIRKIFNDSRIRTTDKLGVVKIFVPATQQSIFDMTIPTYSIARTTLQAAAVGIQLRLARQLDPQIQGFAGSFSPGDPRDLVGPFDERAKTVEQLLDIIVGNSRGATWLATVPDGVDGLPSPAVRPVWVVLQYDRPIADYNSQLSEIARTYPQAKE